jgi:hypothetical protein
MSSAARHLPANKMAIALSSPSPSVLPLPSEPLLFFEGDKTESRTEEKLLADTPVSMKFTRGEQSSPRIRIAPRTGSWSLPACLTWASSTPHVSLSPSASPQTDRARQPSPVNVVNKMDETDISQELPHPMTAPMLSIAVPGHSPKAPSTVPAGKTVL